jgi:hypothetical protein
MGSYLDSTYSLSYIWSTEYMDDRTGDIASSSNYIGVYLVKATVPVPSVTWLFGSALSGLGWIRRNQAA